MRYLVTGGCGFIGSHLCDALVAAGHRVCVLDNLSTGTQANLPVGVEFRSGDVSDERTVCEVMEGVDGCFHLAAVASVEQSCNDWVGTHRVNQQGTVNVLNAARNLAGAPVPVVLASSAAVYGDNVTLPLNETATARPVSAYGADKLGSELHARVAWICHGVPTAAMRFFNVYGPRQNPGSPYSGVISIFIDRVLRGLPIYIYGDGHQTRDFIYVDDVVRFLTAAMAGLRSQATVYNVCTGQSTSIGQLARVLSVVAGGDTEVQYLRPRPADITASMGDPSRAQAALGVKAEVDLGEGLKQTLAAFRTSPPSLR